MWNLTTDNHLKQYKNILTMNTYTRDIWTVRSHMIGRGAISAIVFMCALLAYPIPTVLISLVALSVFRAYEVVLAGVILDALLTPSGGIAGAYTYTALFITAGLCVHVITRVLRGPTHDI